jgi:restriction endonuclease S subunit
VGATREGLAPAKEGVGKDPERYKLVEPGTVFYNPMRILLGSIALLDEGHEPGITSPDYVVFKTKCGFIHPRWLYYWLRSQDGATFIRTLTRGAVRERMLFRRLAAAEIEAPPYEQQLNFALAIQAVERARGAAEAQLNAANALPAAYLRAVFTSPEAQRWPRMRLGEFVLSYRNGFGRRPKGIEKGPIVLRLADVSNGVIDLSIPRCVSMSPDEIETYRLRRGDVLFLRVNGSRELVGRCVLVDIERDDLVYNDHLIRAQLCEGLDPSYLRIVCDLPEIRTQVVEQASTSAGQLTIDQGGLGTIQIPVPSLTEQQRIVARLSEQIVVAETARKALEAQLAAINTLPAALLRRALSGEL